VDVPVPRGPNPGMSFDPPDFWSYYNDPNRLDNQIEAMRKEAAGGISFERPEMLSADEQMKRHLGDSWDVTLTQVKELQRQAAEQTSQHSREMARLRGSYDDLTLAALPEHERAVESVKRRYEKLEDLLPDLFTAGLISWEEATALQEELGVRMEEEIEAVKNKNDELTQFQIQAFRNMQQAGSSFFFSIMRNEYDDLGDHAITVIQRMVAEWMSAQAMMAMVGPTFGKGGDLGGALGWAATGLSTFFAANGAVIDGHFEPIQRFAMGATRIDRATLGWVGEGRLPEAIVPLPDGRTIPVTLSGAMGGTQIVNDIDVTVTAPAGNGQAFDPKTAEMFGKVIAVAVESKVNEVLLKNMRPGGLLNSEGAN
jgi:polyhydroxyalkanoate synthesis regulator phasin